ncbi:MAG TPA: type 4a pilus biogenesis protein PilO [Gaiellaceae bacterium]|nr:type 4a pilus biogenesis protein PilO [Gaiellaceae bacterium]
MTAQRASTGLTREMQIALICGALLFVAIAGYFTLVSSKRSEAKKLRAETVKVQAQIDRTRSTAYAKALPAVKSAAVFRLAQAMPDDVEMPNVMLELNQLAEDSGITFDEITPQTPIADTSFDVQPITVVFTGNYYSLADFLLRVRTLVRIHGGKLITKGRMFSVSGVTFSEADRKFPYISANLTIDSFVLSNGTATPAVPVAGATTTTSTTQTTTSPAASAPSAASSTTPTS